MIRMDATRGSAAVPKTIVVPLDGLKFSERALLPAVNLSKQSGAEIVVLTVRPGGATGDEASELEPAMIRAGAGSARIVVVEARSAADGIAARAASEPEAVICMTTHARSRAGQAMFGTVAEELIRRTDVPILFIGPAAATPKDQRYEQIVVCLDGSHAAAEVIPVATTFAGDLGLDPWLVEVVDPHWREVTSADGIDIEESYALHRVADELRTSGLDANWENLHSDDPAAAIEEFAGTLRSPIIAMTTHGRSGLARVAIGSVAMSVVRRATCPVLITRSRGLEG